MRNQGRRRRTGLGRYTPLLRDPSDRDGGWVVWDSHRQRPVRGLLGVRVFRGLERADRCAGKLNRKAG
jgi:hypothetical protein